jgi:hypothetical protein
MTMDTVIAVYHFDPWGTKAYEDSTHQGWIRCYMMGKRNFIGT